MNSGKSLSRVQWSLSNPDGISYAFDGIPFICIGTLNYHCHQGEDIDKSTKIKEQRKEMKMRVTITRLENGKTFSTYQKLDVRANEVDEAPIIIVRAGDVSHGCYIQNMQVRLATLLLCVRSNVGYIVVAVFIPENEDTGSISEVLRILSRENPEWNPRNMMVDFSLAEISAIEECFPKTHVHVCDFHREKAWGEWLSKSSNGVSMYKDEVLRHLRNIAQSENQATLDENIQALKKSRPWKESVQLQNYFLDFWGLYLEKWVRFFRDEHLRIAIYTNNGIERQNNWLKHSYLESRRNNSVSDLVDVIINHFLPDSYKKYKEQNIRCTSSYRGYDDRVPKYLHDRPRGVVQHIISRIDSGIQISNIKKETPKLFIVQGAECAYQVRLGSDEELPSCQCLDFRTKKLLCKHICAVVQQPDIGWESLGRKFDKYPCLLWIK
ncbi:uncharacterized protein LOC124455456 [Xenia sp. Carnegie-2017]|uniref:uncharacterized protein LOC124455456 n=3 Tax=Xenia sp. Carnegie-2017 TaxID=2897299 RepID=UPI001F049F4B|nr:uncharacterized protein LOC124455456 [Xenia sp. Carnegie-2017]